MGQKICDEEDKRRRQVEDQQLPDSNDRIGVNSVSGSDRCDFCRRRGGSVWFSVKQNAARSSSRGMRRRSLPRCQSAFHEP